MAGCSSYLPSDGRVKMGLLQPSATVSLGAFGLLNFFHGSSNCPGLYALFLLQVDIAGVRGLFLRIFSNLLLQSKCFSCLRTIIGSAVFIH